MNTSQYMATSSNTRTAPPPAATAMVAVEVAVNVADEELPPPPGLFGTAEGV